MTKRIFRSICWVGFIVLLVSLGLIMGLLYEHFSTEQQQLLSAQTRLASQGFSLRGVDFFQGLDEDDLRFTWIGADGRVLYDSQADLETMENHLDRDEVQAALATGYGESRRYSSTLLRRQLYAAQRLPDGTVLRLATSHSSVIALLLGLIQPLLIISAVAILLALSMASRLSRRVVLPLNQLDLDHPLSTDTYDELAPLLRRLDSQQQQIRAQSNELARQREEFAAVIRGMNEGLILLDSAGTILSINDAACRLLQTDASCQGRNMLTVERSLAMQGLLNQAGSGRPAEQVIELGSSSYQLQASPIVRQDRVIGIVLLMFDVTDKERSEQMRREFTANVSHELKTPLHTISGYAELLKGGLVPPEQVEEFSQRIYSEAQRLMALVDDIIHLSFLDEGAGDLKWEETDLYSLAEEAVDGLAPQAKKNNISLSLMGGPAPLRGAPQLLSAIIYNLCDNAIKYNRPGGRVEVSVVREEKEIILRVADTGQGIPREHQGRIFQRFYRVDKSHSKETGGTGLGLSIVKHAARLHQARIDLESAVGEGTVVTVRFPTGAAKD